LKQQDNAVGKVIAGLTVSEKDAGSIVGEDSLFHLEALLVVASSDSEDVSFELLTEYLAVDLLTHSSVEERTATKRVSENAKSRADLATSGNSWNSLLTCTSHLQYQFSFGHQ
jgi:hypothetical protein